jgi:hypothetical protein
MSETYERPAFGSQRDAVTGAGEKAIRARRRELIAAVEAALDEVKGAERYELAQREARSGKARSDGRPHPLEYDANGFPTQQSLATFGARVRRLITGS